MAGLVASLNAAMTNRRNPSNQIAHRFDLAPYNA
jgi:hypothetical protein